MAQESMRTALELQGFNKLAALHHNLPISFLYEEAVRREPLVQKVMGAPDEK